MSVAELIEILQSMNQDTALSTTVTHEHETDWETNTVTVRTITNVSVVQDLKIKG